MQVLNPTSLLTVPPPPRAPAIIPSLFDHSEELGPGGFHSQSLLKLEEGGNKFSKG